MPQQTINIGAAPDDGTGDTIRVGGDKINDNFTELYTDKADKAGGTFTGDISVPDEAYDATAWNGSLEVPTKNAVRDKIESLSSGATTLDGLTDVNAPTPANGDVLQWDSTPGEWVAAAPTGGSNALDDLTDVNAPTPSDGDVLTFNNGTGDWEPAAPTGGGGMVRIGGYTPSAVASFDIENFDGLTAYSQIIIVIEKLTVSDDQTGLTMLLKQNGTYQTANYKYANHGLWAATTASNRGSASAASIELILDAAGGMGNAAGEAASGKIELLNPYDTTNQKFIDYTMKWIDDQGTPRLGRNIGSASYGGTDYANATGGVRIAASSGTLTATVHVYGVVDA